MASFFQPVVFNPNIRYSDAASSSTRFLVYTNATLSRAELFASWYQVVLFILGSIAFCVPLLKVVIAKGLASSWRRRIRRQTAASEASGLFPEVYNTSGSLKNTSSDGSTQNCSSFLASVKTFRHLRQGDVAKFLDLPYDLHIISIRDVLELDQRPCSSKEAEKGNSLAESSDDDRQLPIIWAAVEDADFSVLEFQKAKPAATSKRLKRLCLDNGIKGIVLDSNISKLPLIVQHLAQEGVEILLSTDASHPIERIDLSLVSGEIFQNACILPNGSRRDFFQAAKLRSALSHAVLAQQDNPTFFIGFHDLWDSQPSPAVIRRSHKFANFHGAVLAHGPASEGNTFVSQACLGAFDWLKREDIIRAQNNWMESFKPIEADSTTAAIPCHGISELDSLIPGIVERFKLCPYEGDHEEWSTEEKTKVDSPDLRQAPPRSDFWRVSSQGREMCNAGCYDLREELFDDQYSAVVETQEHLQSLDMLQDFDERDLMKLLDALDQFMASAPNIHAQLINLAAGIRSGNVRIFQGLDSGFTLPDCHGHFWAVSRQCPNDKIILYISLKAPDLVTTIVHCYLGHLGVPRQQRFEIELDILRSNSESNHMHPRIASELVSASYSELLFLVEQLSITETKHSILDTVLGECARLLVEEPTRLAYVKLHSDDFLAKKTTIWNVLNIRLESLSRHNVHFLPDVEQLVSLYSEIDNAILTALLENDESRLERLTAPVLKSYHDKSRGFDVRSDLYALLFFCSLRRRAFEDVYMETTDRCPLFLQQKDQAAVFAELWVLGSQCEVYFGIKPRALGHIIYDEYRAYLSINPPPIESWNSVDVFTAYQKAQQADEENLSDYDNNTNSNPPLPFRDRLIKASFLTIFCVPAIVDVCLLTFVGRGLYLTAFMTLEERIMANYATLASLLITAGVTGWSGSTGGFYLYQSAFINMNHFMVHGLSGGFMLTILLAICGFFAFGVEYSWYAGLIFAAYLMVLSTYLNLLGIMATMHREGAPFKSGRLVLGKCLLITLLSPLITAFFNDHDVMIYLIVLYVFLIVLIFNYSRLCQHWAEWPDKVIIVKESEILEWYRKRATNLASEPEKSPPTIADLKALSNQARESLLEAIENHQAHSRSLSGSSDPFVEKLAMGHKYVLWLLKKESNGQPLPLPYSSTWLVQTKLALANQQQIGRGLKEHSPFLLFRNAKYDLAQNVGLFLIALLDRWIAISMSANGHVVNIYYNVRARYGVAFGLLYFLLCAVSLDVVLQRYWGTTGRQSSERLGNIFDFESTEEAESRREKQWWFQALTELCWVMVCIFGLSTIFVWLFVIDSHQIILYLAYIAGYSSVIIFQFNRVFTMDIKIHVQIVFLAALVGYIIGVILHEIPQLQEFLFNDVIALCCASISAAFGTWLYSDFCDDPSKFVHVAAEESTNWKLHSQKLIGRQNTCTRLNIADLQTLEGAECCHDDETSLSDEIKQVIADGLFSSKTKISDAFPRAKEILQSARDLWINKELKLLTVDREALVAVGGADIFAGSFRDQGVLTVVVGLPSRASWRNVSDSEYNGLLAQLAVEAMVHECCEATMLMSHADATIAELILSPEDFVSTRMLVQFAWANISELRRIAANTNKELLRHLALGCDMNVEWQNTPEDVRKAVLTRALGRPVTKTKALDGWLAKRSSSLELHGLYIEQCLAIHEVVCWRIRKQEAAGSKSVEFSCEEHHWKKHPKDTKDSFSRSVASWMTEVYDFLFLFINFVAIVSRAGSDCGREFWYTVSGVPFQPLIVWIVLKIWKVCSWSKNFWIRTILLPQNLVYKQYHGWLTRGAIRTLTNGLVVESHPRGFRSGFLSCSVHGFILKIYDGLHETEPSIRDHFSATYDKQGHLDQLVHMKKQADKLCPSVHWMYSYDSDENSTNHYPSNRTMCQTNASQDCKEYYDEHGRIAHGECLKKKTRFRFVYKYDSRLKHYSTNILSAIYTSIDLQEPVVFEIFWCLPSSTFGDDQSDVWIPSERVHCLTKRTMNIVEEISWTYDHKMDPTIKRTVRSSSTGASTISEFLNIYVDEFGMQTKPSMNYFVDEDLLYFHQLSSINLFATDPDHTKGEEGPSSNRMLERARIRLPSFFKRNRKVSSTHKLSTTVLRCSIWKKWASSTNVDAMTACLVDEMILRKEPSLRKYWAFRDAGQFLKAKVELQSNLETIVSSIEFADEVAQKVNLAIKPADLFSMGLSKDANFIISRPEASYIDTDNRLAVIFTDTGCWPDAPGGVSNCRRDLVEGHTTIRNYALTESANEFGIPRFKIERNVQLIKNLPLWGLDGKCPSHGLFENLLQSQVERRIRRTKTKDIVEKFIPLLTAFVRGSRTHRLTRDSLIELTDVVLNINAYFEENDYLTTWKSKEVRKAWREAWLCEYSSPNISDPNDAFDIERPTAQDFDEAMGLYISYFFVFSVRVPENVPRVYQSTHHGISSLFGMILKIRRGTTWGIWDHAIMLRESLLNISPAQCILPIAVQTMLIGAMNVAAHLAYMHADIILPCTAIYNPTWEAEIGSDQGLRSSSNIFYRKIDPITNGISSMDEFKPVGKPRTMDPTAIMLSNVQFIKDVKNAILAAGVIINDFGFKNYNLVVYGAQDRQPSYAIETEELIGKLGIGKTVKLGGFGSPNQVLKDAWLFMNSSLSEGLPLAIGEAALSGVPIVATEVGATAQVLTDADDPSILYGEIVPPNDPVGLARAQIRLLAMLGPWAKYTTDDVPPPDLPATFTAHDVEWITKRMHSKADDRQALGLKLREVVLRKFNGDRYLREHEQMYWIQRHMAKHRADQQLEQVKYSHPKFGEMLMPKMLEPPESAFLKGRWQEFDRKILP